MQVQGRRAAASMRPSSSRHARRVVTMQQAAPMELAAVAVAVVVCAHRALTARARGDELDVAV